MRKAINNNPVVQIGLLGVLGVLVAVVFMSGMGGDPAPPPEEDAAATETAAPAAAAPAADPAAAPATGAPVSPAPEAAAPTAAAGSAPFEASPGLPKPFVESYESGDTPVLIVLDENGYEDKALLREALVAKYPDNTAISFAVTGEGSVHKSKNKLDSLPISAYSRIAEGVGLDRTPAIIVVHPMEGKLAKGESAPMPQASISYGYRGQESVVQAVNDALYKGDSKSYAP